MKFTYNWIKEYVDIKISRQRLGELLTDAGLEVVSCVPAGKDWVFEVEVTSNRRDWLSVIGVAREVAAITGSRFTPQGARLTAAAVGKRRGSIERGNYRPAVDIRDKSACRRYIATVITGVRIGPSPAWMQDRLRAVGLRPVNNVVDVTNYVLYETGQPLHAFDWDVLFAAPDQSKENVAREKNLPVAQRKIVVRRAVKGEELTTLDGLKRQLDEGVLVIAAGGRPVALAGIMGGKDTQVTQQTQNILLEVAEFDPGVIRAGGRRLGLVTDSSYRFERGVDPGGLGLACQRAGELICDLSGGEVRGQRSRSLGARPKGKKITLFVDKAEEILGVKISAARIKTILRSLGLGVSRKNGRVLSGKGNRTGFVVSVPSFRGDITIAEDLVEEIARIYGYDNISGRPPYVCCAPNDNGPVNGLSPEIAYGIKQRLSAMGYCEVINYGLISPGELTQDRNREDIMRAENPLSREQEVLRPDIFSGLLRNVEYNLNRKNIPLKIFELGRIFAFSGAAKEYLALGLACCGPGLGLFHLKGALEGLLRDLGITDMRISPGSLVVFAAGKDVGRIIRAFRQREIFAAEIILDRLADKIRTEREFVPWSPYPSTRRDISLFCPADISYERLTQAINASLPAADNMFCDISLREQYGGDVVPAGFKGFLLSLDYGCFRRTLSDEEVSPRHQAVLERLKKIGVVIR